MDNQLITLNDIIKKRRSIFPHMYSDKPISDATILEILENANWAPNHKKTEPWRFKVLKGQKQKDLGRFIATYYKDNTTPEQFKQAKYEKMLKKTSIGGAMILICMQRDIKESIAEWEEIAAVSMAVQNMWLTCTEKGIGAYWGTPASQTVMNEFIALEEGEICLGLFFMGYLKNENIEIPGTRRSISDKIKWYN